MARFDGHEHDSRPSWLQSIHGGMTDSIATRLITFDGVIQVWTTPSGSIRTPCESDSQRSRSRSRSSSVRAPKDSNRRKRRGSRSRVQRSALRKRDVRLQDSVPYKDHRGGDSPTDCLKWWSGRMLLIYWPETHRPVPALREALKVVGLWRPP